MGHRLRTSAHVGWGGDISTYGTGEVRSAHVEGVGGGLRTFAHAGQGVRTSARVGLEGEHICT